MSTEPAEFKAFLSKWRLAVINQSDLWEGPRAVGELRQTAGYLDLILCKPDGRRPARRMLRGVLDEVEYYRAKKEAWQKEFRDTEIFLAKIGRKAERQSIKTSTGDLKNILHTVALGIEKQRIAVKSYIDRDRKVSPLGAVWADIWPQPAKTVFINRGIDLDMRFQYRCAKVFRIFLRALSVRTIARLIVLVYWTARLATVKDDALWIVNERRRITIRSVEEKLVRKKFPVKTREIPLSEILGIPRGRKRTAIRRSSSGST
jgi:hypothetical protein